MERNLIRAQAAAAFLAEIKACPQFTLEISTHELFEIVGLLQLVLRHPHLPEWAEPLVRKLAAGLASLGPTCARLVEAGFDPTQDG